MRGRTIWQTHVLPSVCYLAVPTRHTTYARCAQAVSPACLAVSGEVHVHVTRMKGRGQYKSLHGVESAAASTLLNRLLLVWRLRLCAHTGGRQ